MSGFDDSGGGGTGGRAALVPLRRVDGAAHEMTDDALVAACAVRDGAALGALFDRHSHAVYRYLSRLAGVSRSDLDDLVSATFLEACLSARTFRGGSSVKTWLFAIATNVARHHVRGDVRRRMFLSRYQLLPLAASNDRPDDALDRRRILARLDAVLQSLPHDLRVAFVMCDVEDVPCAEAARALGLRQGTLWKRLQRARFLLGSAFE